MGTFSNIASIFSDIANSLRSKMGSQDTFTPSQMAGAVNNIPTGAQIDEYINTYATEYVLGVTGINERVVQYNINDGTKWDVSDASNLFNNNQTTFEQYSVIRFGDNVTNMCRTFNNCRNFNRPVIIGNNVTDLSYTFSSAQKFNQPITIPNSVTDMSYTFNRASSFNQPITIPNSVTNMSYIFNGVDSFNHPITIPNSVKNMAGTFSNTYFFNHPITIPNGVENISNIFSYARRFNQPITIPNSVKDASKAFMGCYNFNRSITISDNVENMINLLRGCERFSSNIYFNNSSTITNSFKITDMFSGCNELLKKSIYCNNAAPFIKYTYDSWSIVGGDVTWDALSDGNGYYNTYYNVYIYNNWTPS